MLTVMDDSAHICRTQYKMPSYTYVRPMILCVFKKIGVYSLISSGQCHFTCQVKYLSRRMHFKTKVEVTSVAHGVNAAY